MRKLPTTTTSLAVLALALPAAASAHRPACTRHHNVVRCLHHGPTRRETPPVTSTAAPTVPLAPAAPEAFGQGEAEAQAQELAAGRVEEEVVE